MEQAERLMNQHYQFKSQFMKNLEKEIFHPKEDEEFDVEVISCPSYSAPEEEDEDVPDSDEEKYWNGMFEQEKQSRNTYSFYQNDKKNYYKMCTCCIDSCQAGGCPVQKMLNRDFKPESEEEVKIDKRLSGNCTDNTFPFYDNKTFIMDSKDQKPDSTELVIGLKNDIPLAFIFELCENLEKMYPIETTDKPFQRIDYCGTHTNNHLLVNEMMSLILHHEKFENHFLKLVINDTLPDVYSFTFKYMNIDEYYYVIDKMIMKSESEDELYQKQFLNCFLQIWIMRDYITYFEHQSLIGIRDENLVFDHIKAREYVKEYGYSYKMMIILTHLMNHYYGRNIYPSMKSLLLHIYYIHDDELDKTQVFDL